MKLIDRISLHKLLNTILNFIITVLKIIVPNKNVNNPDPRKRRLKIRRDNE